MRFMIFVKATKDIEIRQLYELEDFEEVVGDSNAIERLRETGIGGA